jgi:hypothetical protein
MLVSVHALVMLHDHVYRDTMISSSGWYRYMSPNAHRNPEEGDLRAKYSNANPCDDNTLPTRLFHVRNIPEGQRFSVHAGIIACTEDRDVTR